MEYEIKIWNWKWWKLEDEISWTKKPPMKTLEDIELEFRNEELWVRTNMLEYNTVRGWGSNKKQKSKLKFEKCKFWVWHWYLKLRQKLKLKKH